MLSSTKAGSDEENSKKDDMDQLLPFLFLLSGSPSVGIPTVWIMGVICLTVMAAFGAGS